MANAALKVETEKRALVVEPSEDFADIVGFFLGQAGFSTRCVADVDSAVRAMGEEHFDLVVAEVDSPRDGGMSLLRHITSVEGQRPAVVLMTQSPERFVDDAYANGAEAVFAKPVHFEAFSKLAARAVRPKEVETPYRPYRAPVRIPALVGLGSQGQPRVVQNLHHMGLFVEWNEDHLPMVGEVLDFTLPMRRAGLGNVAGKASVRWVRSAPDERGPRGVGLQIQTVQPTHGPYLLRLVNAARTGGL